MTPGYPPHHPGLHPTQSSTTTPGSIGTSTDDDKGRGSYKCGRCGVPKKGHICPYQPKVKRKSDDPAPEMKCVSTQVEMDEFMTLRRLNIEIQGFPESYAAEPSDNCGTEVHPPPPPPHQQHHAAMTPSSLNPQRGPPPSVAGPPGGMVKPGMAPIAHLSGPSSSRPPSGAPVMSQQQEQGPPTSLPSLSSMPSQPHPSSSSAIAAGGSTATIKQPEQINSSAAFKSDTATSTASEANVKAEEATKTETKASNEEEEATKVDSATNVDEEELKQENANKDVVETTEETSADDTTKSDDANKKRSASEEEKTGDEKNSSESPVKKQKV